MKIVVNKCFGGFGLSEDAYKELGILWDGYGYGPSNGFDRSCPKLVAVVEKLGDNANGNHANLRIGDINV